jgi:hypothetical protein
LLAIILRTEDLIIIKENSAWCMKLYLITQGVVKTKECAEDTYLRVQIVDLSDRGINIASVDSPSYLYAWLNGLLFERQLHVRFLGELLSSSRVAFADQVVHDDEVDVPEDTMSAAVTSSCAVKRIKVVRVQIQVKRGLHTEFSERFPTSLRSSCEGRGRSDKKDR